MTTLLNLPDGTCLEDDALGWRLFERGVPGREAYVASTRIMRFEKSGTTSAGAPVFRHPSGLEVSGAVRRFPEYNAVRRQLTLRLPESAPAPVCISAICPLWLDGLLEGVSSGPAPGAPAVQFRVRTMTGGTTHTVYPPVEYRVHEAAFLAGHDIGYRIGSATPDGRTSFRHLPFFLLQRGSGGLVCGMEWSGPWSLEIDRPHKALCGVVWFDGVIPPYSHGEPPVLGTPLTLMPGQTLRLPAVHLVFFRGDCHDGGNAWRRYLRQAHAPKLGGRPPLPPLSYDSWFGLGLDIDEPLLRKQAERAAELGLEYFVLDAGWYAGCHDPATGRPLGFMHGMGNWEHHNPVIFPSGLKPLAETVRRLGLKFGLFFETLGRAHRGSRWATERPELFLDLGAESLYINLALPEAQKLVLETTDRWVRELDLKWLRWEHGFGPRLETVRRDPARQFLFRYLEGLSAVSDALMERHPDLILELCSEGGNRIDLATLKRAHTAWFTDANEVGPVVSAMICGAARFLPANFLNAAVPVARGRGDAAVAEAAVVRRMGGALSFGGDIASLSPEKTRRLARMIELYRSIRPLLVEDFFPLTPQPQRPEDGEAVLFARYDRSEAVLFAFAGIDPTGNDEPMALRLRGLTAESAYAVTNLLTGKRAAPEQTGSELMRRGLEVRLRNGVALLGFRRLSPRK